MPGTASLAAGEYYAHPRNGFWPIMAELLGFSPQLPYARRLERLVAARIALWDVAHQCFRPGSLDQNIAVDSVQTNDFRRFFAEHPHLALICFNGSAAERLYRRLVLPHLSAAAKQMHIQRLPSTSPAHAALSMAAKAAVWQEALRLP